MGARDDRPPPATTEAELQQYADAKSRVVEAIIARALADPDGATETR
jgi:hypothetical protein